MAPTDKPVLTYHVVPRFDMSAAKGGPLTLGTVLADLKLLIPLNHDKDFVQVPDDIIYPSVTHTDFKETLGRAREANLDAWLNALGIPVGLRASFGVSREVESTVSCESVVTTYFDPKSKSAYIKDCFNAEKVKEWLEEAENNTDNLYLVTGLKVAKKLKFNRDEKAETHGGGEASAQEPNTNAINVGIKADASDSKTHKIEFEVDDIVLGFRVNRYRCTRGWFNKKPDGTTTAKGVLEGNMHAPTGTPSQVQETQIELLPIPEVVSAEKQAADAGEEECWLSVPDDDSEEDEVDDAEEEE